MGDSILDWINLARKAGLDDHAITSHLEKSGWTPEQIKSALSGITPPPVPPHLSGDSGTSGHLVVSQRHRKLGTIFVIAPFGLLLMILFGWSIMIFVFAQSNDGATEPTGVLAIVEWALGFFGMIAAISIFVLVPIGVYYLNKKTNVDYSQTDPRSGKGEQSIIPAEITGWNWGAALLSWIWGIGNGVWISLLVFVPFFNIVWWIFLGLHGNEWAWKARAWESVDAFKATQRAWSKWGLILFLAPFSVLIIVTLIAIFSNR